MLFHYDSSKLKESVYGKFITDIILRGTQSLCSYISKIHSKANSWMLVAKMFFASNDPNSFYSKKCMAIKLPILISTKLGETNLEINGRANILWSDHDMLQLGFIKFSLLKRMGTELHDIKMSIWRELYHSFH